MVEPGVISALTPRYYSWVYINVGVHKCTLMVGLCLDFSSGVSIIMTTVTYIKQWSPTPGSWTGTGPWVIWHGATYKE